MKLTTVGRVPEQRKLVTHRIEQLNRTDFLDNLHVEAVQYGEDRLSFFSKSTNWLSC